MLELFPYVGQREKPRATEALEAFLEHHTPEQAGKLAGFLAAHVLNGIEIRTTRGKVQGALGFRINDNALDAARVLRALANQTVSEIWEITGKMRLSPTEERARRRESGMTLRSSLDEFATALRNRLKESELHTTEAERHYTHPERILMTILLSRVDRRHFYEREDAAASEYPRDRTSYWNQYARQKFGERRVQRLLKLYRNAKPFFGIASGA